MRARLRRVEGLLNANFGENDLWVTLTYRGECPGRERGRASDDEEFFRQDEKAEEEARTAWTQSTWGQSNALTARASRCGCTTT